MPKELKTTAEIEEMIKSRLKKFGYDIETVNVIKLGDDWNAVVAGSSASAEFREAYEEVRDTLRCAYSIKD
ncbi:hypothetical protein [Brucella sp.]|uniref:hypothetical protein n=1 Tax=Brucella sp. TaxID=52132 RepID=UPI0028A256F8|nr:hypothetical protein [Brucella sp.]